MNCPYCHQLADPLCQSPIRYSSCNTHFPIEVKFIEEKVPDENAANWRHCRTILYLPIDQEHKYVLLINYENNTSQLSFIFKHLSKVYLDGVRYLIKFPYPIPIAPEQLTKHKIKTWLTFS